MTIGIIGIGSITLDFAYRAVKANHQVLLNSPRGNYSYQEIISRWGINAKLTSITEAAQAEIIILSLPREGLKATLNTLPSMTGKIILHTNNALFNPESPLFIENPKSSCEIVADLLPTADVIKIFNVITPAGVSSNKEKHCGNIFFSGGNSAAKKNTKTFLQSLDYSGVDINDILKPDLIN